MNPIWVDIFALLALVMFVSGGYRMGLFGSILAWGGLFLGVVAGGLIVGALFKRPEDGNPAEGFVFALMIVITLAFLGQSLGVFGGNVLKSKMKNKRFRQADVLAGAFAGFAVWAALLWIIVPAVADRPGITSQAVRGSKIAQIIDDGLPTPPNVLGSLENFVGSRSFPQVFDSLRPAPEVPDPPKNLPMSEAEANRIANSTVQVIAYACGNHIQQGSGFFLRPNVVVTNAHVIAGGSELVVMDVQRNRHKVSVIAFDPVRDLALLDTGSFSEPALPTTNGEIRENVAIFGHPGGQQALRIAAGNLADRVNAVGKDIYDQGLSTRKVLVMAAPLRQGDSGSGVVNKYGQIVGITFAIAPDDPRVSYALDISELNELLASPQSFQRSTGRCMSE